MAKKSRTTESRESNPKNHGPRELSEASAENLGHANAASTPRTRAGIAEGVTACTSSNADKPNKIPSTNDDAQLYIVIFLEIGGTHTLAVGSNNRTTPKGGDSPKTQQRKGSFDQTSSRATVVNIDDLGTEDVVIAIWKKLVYHHVTGAEAKVGHGLQSCTSEIQVIKLQSPNSAYDVVFVDTPGFDDTPKSVTVILNLIPDWLNKTYNNRILLSGILYFHQISDNHMAGTPLKNLDMFQKLCGKNALENVILTTTVWDEVDERTGSAREEELKSKYWSSMLAKKSRTSRFLNTPQSAWAVLDPILRSAHEERAFLLRTEMGELRRTLPETSVGHGLFNTMEELLKKQQHVLRRLPEETIKSTDSDILETLTAEYCRLQREVGETMEQMKALQLPFGKRLLFKLRPFNR
ncbi:hypothetical protein JAAARDRAFT_197776 [Jaapia argillacea MUCL 33604]|uniref:G domain-containing protein n=1 Tax=Jaapia argillacea MUCL 33604 TaxID=933084 RepID=A0A067PE15_9AGAM|nr:hypothetical protein JAAARDRAFT_197776 [Jaapia argillacea MUCL 33604]